MCASAVYWETLNKLRSSLLCMNYLPGSRLPGIRELEQEYGVGFSTIYRCIRQLQKEQLIISTRGRNGTRVNREAPYFMKIAVFREESLMSELSWLVDFHFGPRHALQLGRSFELKQVLGMNRSDLLAFSEVWQRGGYAGAIFLGNSEGIQSGIADHLSPALWIPVFDLLRENGKSSSTTGSVIDELLTRALSQLINRGAMRPLFFIPAQLYDFGCERILHLSSEYGLDVSHQQIQVFLGNQKRAFKNLLRIVYDGVDADSLLCLGDCDDELTEMLEHGRFGPVVTLNSTNGDPRGDSMWIHREVFDPNELIRSLLPFFSEERIIEARREWHLRNMDQAGRRSGSATLQQKHREK